jgi:hypothetical protein
MSKRHGLPIIHNAEAEQAVLAALMYGAKIEHAGPLTAEDFCNPLAARIFACIRRMHERAEPVSLLAIIERMGLDETEQVWLGSIDVTHTPRPDVDLAANAAIVHRIALERSLRHFALDFANANSDSNVLPLALELGRRTQNFLAAAKFDAGEEVPLFDAQEELNMSEKPKFSIEGFAQQDTVTAIAALSGQGKTWLSLAVAKALLYGPGQKLWDLFQVNTRAEKVIYLIPEATRSTVKDRLERIGIYEEIGKRLFVRTLNMGPVIELSDPRLLREAEGAYLFCDTAIRFMKAGDENAATEVAKGLSDDFFALLRAKAVGVFALFHSPKFFREASAMTLENMMRGSSELGAAVATAWGLKQLDASANVLHVQNLKARDFEPCGAFQLIGRPYIDESGDFGLHKRPEDCGSLADEQPDRHRGGGAPQAQREAKAANIALMREWLARNPALTSKEIAEKFARADINVGDSAVRKYRKEL